MKKLIAIIITVALLSISCATSGKPAAGTVSMDKAIADAADGLSAKVSDKTEIVIAAIKAPDSATEDFLTAELITYLMNNDKFTVLERGDALKAVNAEQQFQMSGLVSDESAVGIGHYLGAKVVVTGTFDLYNDFNQLRLRAVDVRSSQLLAMTSSRVNPKDRILANIMPKDIKPQRIQEQTLDHLSLGKDLYREKKYDEAIREYDEAIRLEPNNAETYAARATAYAWGKKDYDSAIADYTTAISLGGNNTAFMYYMRGAMYYQFKRDDDKAIADFTQAIKLNPNHVDAYSVRADIYSRKRDYDQAIRDLTQAIKLAPNDITLYIQRAGIYSGKEEYDLAIADYTQVIRRAHKEKDAFELGSAYDMRGFIYYLYKKDYDKAIADYTEALQFTANDKRYSDDLRHSSLGRLHMSLGDAYNAKNDNSRAVAEYENAITGLTEAIRLNPNGTYVYRLYGSRGGAYFAKKDYNRAIADYETALKLDPDDKYGSIKSGLEEAREARGN